MRILMLIDSYPPTIGGAQIHVRHLAGELACRGHEVAVATLWQPGLAEFELDGGVRVYRLRGSAQRAARLLFRDGGRSYAPPFPDPELTLALRRVARRERPDVVHGHNWLLYSFLPLKAWSGARVVATLHEYSLA